MGARPVALLLAVTVLSAVRAATPLTYPDAPRGPVVDSYHGHTVADPYRWLEDSSTSESARWLRSEAQLTTDYLSTLHTRNHIARRLTELSDSGHMDVPWCEAGKVFWLESRAGRPQPVLRVASTPGEKGRDFFDPNRISPDGSVEVSDLLVSPDAHLLAYRAARGGADRGEIRVRDMASDRDTPDVVDGYNACWTRDGRGFFYAQPVRTAGSDDSSARAGMRACYHRLGDTQDHDVRVVEWGQSASWIYFMTSEDGRHAAAVAEMGPVSEIYMVDLGDPQHPHVESTAYPLLARSPAFHTPVDWAGDTFYVRTALDAPHARIVALDLRDREGATPRTIVPEASDVIVDAVIAGGRLVVNYLSDVHSRVRLFDLDGTAHGEIPLPGLGAVGWPLSSRVSSPELFFSFQSFLEPTSILSCNVRTGKVHSVRRGRAAFDANRYETRQVFYPSKDGTRIPMFVTAPRGVALDGSHPVFLTAYGGYGSTMLPAYSADVPVWLEQGGIYALANIRGGGEYGEAWHRAGMLEHKQTSFDDFIAAAEYLVKTGYTQPGRIAVYGHSNGGLLIGAVLTQRPDLFGAAVANAGHYDMLRYQRFTAGAAWVAEYGSSDDSTAFDYLRAYSPLQNVRPGTCYPATLLLAADHDDRVVPAHAYKFAAALQAAQACDHPVLLRVAVNASHNYASQSEMIAEHADMFAFILANLAR